MSVENRVILTVACTGAWPQKSDTPYIPLTRRTRLMKLSAAARLEPPLPTFMCVMRKVRRRWISINSPRPCAW